MKSRLPTPPAPVSAAVLTLGTLAAFGAVVVLAHGVQAAATWPTLDGPASGSHFPAGNVLLSWTSHADAGTHIRTGVDISTGQSSWLIDQTSFPSSYNWNWPFCTAGSYTWDAFDMETAPGDIPIGPKYVSNARSITIDPPSATPQTPTVPSASAQWGPGPKQVTVSWGQATGTFCYPVVNYEVWWGTSPGNENTLVYTAPNNVFTYQHGGLTPGQENYYKVKAVVTSTVKSTSAEVHDKDYDTPGAPTALTVEQSALGQVTLYWNAPTYWGGDTAWAFLIYRSDSANSVWSVASGTTFWIQDGVPPGISYTYTVKAVNYHFTSAASNGATITLATTPGSPASITATALTSHSIKVAWTPATSNGGSAITGYQLYDAATGAAIPGATTSPYTQTGIPCGTLKSYIVKAHNAWGWGDPATASATTPPDIPAAPTGVTATAGPGAGTVTVAWAAVANCGSTVTYHILASTAAGAEVDSTATSATTSKATTVGPGGIALVPGTTYYFRVTAQNSVGTSPASSGDPSAAPYTTPGAPQALAFHYGDHALENKLDWSTPVPTGYLPATAYHLYRRDHGATDWGSPRWSGPGLAFVDNGAGGPTVNGGQYDYKVTAYEPDDATLPEGPGAETTGRTWATLAGSANTLGATIPICAGQVNPPTSICPPWGDDNSPMGWSDHIVHATTDAGADENDFLIEWGQFNRHMDLRNADGTTFSKFWMHFRLDLGGSAMPPDPAKDGAYVKFAHLERYDAVGGHWTTMPDADMYGTLHLCASQSCWTLTPDTGIGTHLAGVDMLQTDSHYQTVYRLVAEPLPTGAGTFRLSVQTVQAELVAPPLVFVHGFNPAGYLANEKAYLDDVANWADDFASGMKSSAEYNLGQNPWSWAKDNRAFSNVEYNGKQDLRSSTQTLEGHINAIHAGYQRGLKDGNFETDFGNVPRTQDSDGVNIAFLGPVDVIAHSAGGLVARYMIETKLAQEGHTPERMVANLITMGTPNLGSNVVQYKYNICDQSLTSMGSGCQATSKPKGQQSYYVDGSGRDLYVRYQGWKYGWWGDGTTTRNSAWGDGSKVNVQIDPELMDATDANPVIGASWYPTPDALENTYHNHPRIGYFHLAGDVCQAGAFWHDGSCGDGAVGTDSATHNRDSKSCSYIRHDPGYGHDYNAPGSTSRMMDKTFFRDLTTSYLEGYRNSGICNDSGAGFSLLSASAPAAAYTDDPHKDETRARLVAAMTTAGGNSIATFHVSASGLDEMTLNVHSEASLQGAMVAVTRPDGTVNSFSDVQGLGTDIGWSGAFDVAPFPFGSLFVDHPADGDWTIAITYAGVAADPPQGDLVMHGSLAVGDRTDTMVQVASDATLRGVVWLNGVPQTGAVVTATTLDSITNATVTVDLHDDGVAPDASAGDGVYAGSFRYALPGVYPVTITATYGGVTRQDSRTVGVYITFGEWRRTCASILLSSPDNVIAEAVQLDLNHTVACLANSLPFDSFPTVPCVPIGIPPQLPPGDDVPNMAPQLKRLLNCLEGAPPPVVRCITTNIKGLSLPVDGSALVDALASCTGATCPAGMVGTPPACVAAPLLSAPAAAYAGWCAPPSGSVGSGTVVVSNGLLHDNDPTSDSDAAACYNDVTKVWYGLPPAPTRRSQAVGVSVGTVYYVIGGKSDACGPTKVCGTVDAYDSTTGAWTTLPNPMPVAVAGAGAAAWGNQIFVFGGRTCAVMYGCGAQGNVQVLDLSTLTWSLGVMPMPTPRADVQSVTLSSAPIPGFCAPMIVAGGNSWGAPASELASVDIFDACVGAWATPGTIPDMPLAVQDAVAISGASGICVVGGFNHNVATNAVQRYDIASNAWTLGPPNAAARPGLAGSAISSASGQGILLAKVKDPGATVMTC
ncbi:MAG: choice-of-anchor X domain-containing protein [bacterium]